MREGGREGGEGESYCLQRSELSVDALTLEVKRLVVD